MKNFRLENMKGGWFVGDFHPVVSKTNQFEVAVKRYKAGDVDLAHYHKIATEITVVVSGRVLMCDHEWSDGDIIVIEPGEVVQFQALTDAVLTVVKTPSVCGDKYPDAGGR